MMRKTTYAVNAGVERKSAQNTRDFFQDSEVLSKKRKKTKGHPPEGYAYILYALGCERGQIYISPHACIKSIMGYGAHKITPSEHTVCSKSIARGFFLDTHKK